MSQLKHGTKHHGLNRECSSISDIANIKGLLLLSLNVRSLLPKINCLRTDFFNLSFDFFALCEKWLKPTIADGLLNIANYSLVRADRTTRNCNGDLKPGGGHAIYYDPVNVCNVLNNYCCCTDDIELMSVGFT